ncbi:ABC transporter permease [Succinatimonas hippei]|uniref:ABC transporter permease n=1 Tax=Succinatimonas hippei TaxID=626938 RepID=UPI0020117434|nr:ABC transporter permease [Succinatimonas hippei]MCL1603494.1 ABC transporter permease [Succinatimonas hippei]
MELLNISLLKGAFVTEYRVITALMLREIHTIYGNSRIGYLWVLIQSAFNIGVFWAIREIAGASSPHGMSIAMFLIAGFGIWNVVSNCISKSLTAVSANKVLLTFPQVTELDVIVARCLVLWFTQIVVSLVLVIVAIGIGFDIYVTSWLDFYICIFTSLLLGLGIGLLLQSFAVFLPVIERVVPLVLRVLFFASGLFYSISTFTQDIAEILLLNPIAQLIELFRSSLSYGYPSDGCSWVYVMEFTLITLSLGLVTERYVRSRRKE